MVRIIGCIWGGGLWHWIKVMIWSKRWNPSDHRCNIQVTICKRDTNQVLLFFGIYDHDSTHIVELELQLASYFRKLMVTRYGWLMPLSTSMSFTFSFFPFFLCLSKTLESERLQFSSGSFIWYDTIMSRPLWSGDGKSRRRVYDPVNYVQWIIDWAWLARVVLIYFINDSAVDMRDLFGIWFDHEGHMFFLSWNEAVLSNSSLGVFSRCYGIGTTP